MDISKKMIAESLDIFYHLDLNGKLPPREEVEKLPDPVGLVASLTRTDGECRTPDTIYRLHTKGNKVFYEIELPEGKEVSEAVLGQLEDVLRNAAEAALQQMWVK